MEVLKRALRELAEREPAFFRDLFLEAIRGDGRAAELLTELLTKYPEARRKLAQTIAATLTIPLNVATKQDIEELKQWTEAKLKRHRKPHGHQGRPQTSRHQGGS